MTKAGGLRAFLTENALFYAVGFLMALALKYHYSVATSEDLEWVLAPTAALVGLLTGIPFEKEAQTGYLSTDWGVIIAPACAGVNFLIVAFGVLCVAGAHRMKGTQGKLTWLGMSAAMAYCFTLAANGLRIIASVYLLRADIYGGWATPERVHRIEGTLVYFFFLLLVYPIGARIAGRLGSARAKKSGAPVAMPHGPAPLVRGCIVAFTAYLLVTVGVPFLNRGWRQNGPQFIEHCLQVLAVCLILLPLYLLIVLGFQRLGTAIRKARGG